MTKSTVWGSVLLVVMVAALFGYRTHLRAICHHDRKQLEQFVPQLDAYAARHGHRLPATLDALQSAVGPLPTSSLTQVTFVMEAAPGAWRATPPRVYLRTTPYPFINSMIVIMTDGAVRIIEDSNQMGASERP